MVLCQRAVGPIAGPVAAKAAESRLRPDTSDHATRRLTLGFAVCNTSAKAPRGNGPRLGETVRPTANQQNQVYFTILATRTILARTCYGASRESKYASAHSGRTTMAMNGPHSWNAISTSTNGALQIIPLSAASLSTSPAASTWNSTRTNTNAHSRL